jgi:hypothetical protein
VEVGVQGLVSEFVFGEFREVDVGADVRCLVDVVLASCIVVNLDYFWRRDAFL